MDNGNEGPAGSLRGDTEPTDSEHTEDPPSLVDSQLSSVCNVCVKECGCCKRDGSDCCGEGCGCCPSPTENKAQCLIVGGKCQTCKLDNFPPTNIVKCFVCKHSFHALGCDQSASKLVNKSLLTSFHRLSTRKNFLFSCDSCLTKSEMLKADKEQASYQLLHNRINQLESIIMTELKVIKSQLPKPSEVTTTSISPASSDTSVPTNISSVEHPPTSTHGWSDQAKIAACKSKSTFIIKPSSGEPGVDMSKLNDIAIEHSIAIDKTSVNDKGHAIVVVDGEASSKAFMPVVSNAVSGASVVQLPSKLPTVVFVAIDKSLSSIEPDRIQETLCKCNPTLNSLVNDKSFKILKVKPLKNKPDVFQFVARVSNDIRSHLKNLDDKVFFGVNRLVIYDHFFVRRCNKCQEFGHFESRCKSTVQTCGVCAMTGHSANSCSHKETSSSHRCFNCVKNKFDHNHLSSSPTCQSFVNEQTKLMRSISFYNSGPKNFNRTSA